MVSGATCSGRPGAVGCCVAGGLAGADDGGAVAVGVAETDGLAGADGLAVGVGTAVLLVGDDVAVAVVVGAVVVGAAELLEGAGAGGPKQPESANRALNARTLNAESLGLVMMPPWVLSRHVWDLPSKYAGAARRKQGLKSDAGPAVACGWTRPADVAGCAVRAVEN
ncbi:hypothetical protein [Arthrobacter sp. 92]|uniref:hypothetical protein n=1 Tax=Arthrobacter sp. 92 TaxID=3418175 RepID=UPI003CFD3270